jgi:EAL domain-containing protein (putative c-di-GMP-specific phosphodiesterase class I)
MRADRISVRSVDETHARRVKAALKYLAVFCAINGIAWMLFFGGDTNPLLLAANILTLLSGIGTYVLTKRGYTKPASYYLFSLTIVALVLLCVFLDLPSPIAPRVSHYYFLVMALCSYWIYEYESDWLRFGVSSLSLVLFIVFASSNFDFITTYRISDEVRELGAWVNSFFVVFILCVIFYVMQSDAILRIQGGAEINDALYKQQFELFYQPQVDSSSRILGAEVLLRWHHPQKGLTSPLQFIPMAESAGLMVPLGYWVLTQACRQLAEWNGTLFEGLHLSVNVSAQQFNEPDFVEHVKKIVDSYGIDFRRLNLELTESIVIQNTEQVIAKMHSLRALGIGVSLDDFGTGYSSLSYLKNLPLDQLKIDKAFVKEILANELDAKIANYIIHLAKDLGHCVIAEGVETEAQRDFLLSNGCELYQGYLFSRPLPIAEFERYVHDRQSTSLAY